MLFKDIKIWDKILSEIFKKPIHLVGENISINKDYGSLYQEFKNNYLLPKDFLIDLQNNDPEFKIYNTVEEQEKYIKYWLEKSY